jgi:hypothetical protein
MVGANPLATALNVCGKSDVTNVHNNKNKSLRPRPNIRNLVIRIPSKDDHKTNEDD